MMIVCRLTLLMVLALSIGWCNLASAQQPSDEHEHDHDHDHDWQTLLAPSTRPPADYTLEVTLLPESSLVRFTMELIYHHRGNDTVQSLIWRLPVKTYLGSRDSLQGSVTGFFIDSISHRAVPLEPDQIQFVDTRHLQTRLHAPMVPNQVTSLFLSGELVTSSPNVPELWMIPRWFPRILVPRALSTYNDTSGAAHDAARYPLAIAQIEVAITLDTTHFLAYAGRLLNEKEHFGFLPQAHPGHDTAFYNITDGRYLNFGTYTYDPIFADGEKSYYIKANHTTNLPLAVGTSWRTDRIIYDSLQIDLFHVGQAPDSVCTALSNVVHQTSRWLAGILGWPQSNRLAVVVVDAPTPETGYAHLAFCNLSDNQATARVNAARSLIRLWLPPIWSSDTNTYGGFEQGLIRYFTHRIAESPSGPISTRDFQQWEQQRRLDLQVNDTGLINRNLLRYPARLEKIRQSLGDSTFNKRLRDWLKKGRRGYIDPADLFTSLTCLPSESKPVIDDWGRVLDPNHRLNDPDRSDNLFRLKYTRTRIPQPETELFHAFTPLPL